MIATIRSVVATGRRMKGSETFIVACHRCPGWSGPPAAALCARGRRVLRMRRIPVLPRLLPRPSTLAAAVAAARRCGRRLAVLGGGLDMQAVAPAVGGVADRA